MEIRALAVKFTHDFFRAKRPAHENLHLLAVLGVSARVLCSWPC